MDRPIPHWWRLRWWRWRDGRPQSAPAPVRRPLSLAARSSIATSLALAGFLGLTGFALDRAYAQAELSALNNRLKSYAYAYLAGIDVSNRSGHVFPPDLPANSDFARPGSGLYAVVLGQGGYRWQSPSALGLKLPFESVLSPGQVRFEGPLETPAGRVYLLSQGFEYDQPGGEGYRLTIDIAESEVPYLAELTAFQRTLFGWLGALGLALLVLQQILLRWSLWPLRRVAGDLARIERGQADHLSGSYPQELTGLTLGLNRFIRSEREHLQRYRNTLDDLAHSLKTPLAVSRSQLESSQPEGDLREGLLWQVQRMDRIVAYQLTRAKTSGHPTFATPVPVQEHAEAVVRSLERVYSNKKVLCEFDIDEQARFYGEEGDLLELLGNLLENAFKWSQHRTLLGAHSVPLPPGPRVWRAGLEVTVEDDGPGIPPEQLERVLQRGVRGDERVQGHGIGLAIVDDIVRAYGGSMQVDRSEELGGARFRVSFLEL
jgi:two-component system, OmpR family, sensor histidine kinase PhoQ